MKEATYNSFERGSYHFRKRLPHRYLVNYSKDTMYRISLRKVAKSFYHILLNDVEKLNALTRYINIRVNVFLELKEEVTLDQISELIYDICEDYRNEAIIENSSIELKRIEALEYTDKHGVQAGHSLQAITKAYKEVSTQYDRLTIDTQKTYTLGSEIVKRSNITKDQLLDIPEDKRLQFYEMLIKAEKYILEQDIKLYITRNLYQFSSLITEFEGSDEQQSSKAYSEYLNLIHINKPQVNYLQFIRSQKREAILTDIDSKTLFENFLAQMKIDDEDKLLNVTTSIKSLINQFIAFKSLSVKREKAMKVALSYFKDYLSGDASEYKPLNISDLTASNLEEFQSLLIDCCPKNKKTASKTLFEMVRLRRENNHARYAINTIDGYQSAIKQFLIYIAKYHKNLGLDKDFIGIFNPKMALAELKEINSEQDIPLRAFKISELNLFINTAYNPKKLKKTLLSSPRNFYVFFFALITGTRLEEALLIALDDIKVQKKFDKKYYYIYLNEDKKYQHLKNPNAHRNIPIPDIMIELGLLNYINRRKMNNYQTLFDFPASASASIAAYYRRNFQKLFPDFSATQKNRDLGLSENFIQFRSLRKNFANFLFDENQTKFDTEANKKRLFGHSYGITSIYLGRLEPYIAYEILNTIQFDKHIDITSIKRTIRNHWVSISYDLKWLDEELDAWKKISKVRPKRGRKV